jgi:hypothetical protein
MQKYVDVDRKQLPCDILYNEEQDRSQKDVKKKKRTQFLLDDHLKEKVKKNNVSERVDQP